MWGFQEIFSALLLAPGRVRFPRREKRPDYYGLSKTELAELARYKAAVSRGVTHDGQHQLRMLRLQDCHDHPERYRWIAEQQR